jgi:uncharacterized protein
MTSPLRVALRNRLKVAMRAHDRQTAGAMRSVLATLENAEAVPVTSPGTPVSTSEHVAGAVVGLGVGEVPRRLLSLDDERALVIREVAELRLSSAELAAAGQQQRSSELIRIAETVEEVLMG